MLNYLIMTKEEIISILQDNRSDIDRGNWDSVYQKEFKDKSRTQHGFTDFLLDNDVDPSTMFKKTIPGFAFTNSRSEKLTSINIAQGVTEIGAYAFDGCRNLIHVEIPTSVLKIKDRAFARCIKLSDINLPNNISLIEDYAFYECSSLTQINIPTSSTKINYGAFMGCRSLTSITIPNSITEISAGAFMNCRSLTEVKFDGTVEEWRKVKVADDAFKSTPVKNKKNIICLR